MYVNEVTIKPKLKKHFCAIKPIEIRRLVIRVTSKRSQLQVRSFAFAKCETKKTTAIVNIPFVLLG